MEKDNGFFGKYANFLRQSWDLKKTVRVVFDFSNGTTGLVVKKLVAGEKNLEYFFINEKPDGNFPGHGPNPSGFLKQLQKDVLRKKADLGVAFDADGDRAVFVDNRGREMDPDETAALLIWQLQPKKIIYDERTGYLVRRQDYAQAELFSSKVGNFFIKRAMREKDADLGVERSGHYYFKKFFYLDSGIFAAINAINAVSRLPYTLGDFVDLLPCYVRSGEQNMKAEKGDRAVVLVNKAVLELKKQYSRRAKIVSEMDGLFMEFSQSEGDWWFHIRSSNTEPVVRLNFEATNGKIFKSEYPKLTAFLKRRMN